MTDKVLSVSTHFVRPDAILRLYKTQICEEVQCLQLKC